MAWTIEISDTGDVMRISRDGILSGRELRPEPRVTVLRDVTGPCVIEILGDPVAEAVDALVLALVANLAPEARMVVQRHLRTLIPAEPELVEQT